MDIRATITDAIIDMIESGAAKNEPPFQAFTRLGMPRNHATRAPYSGSNILCLWRAAAKSGFLVNEWLTFKQADDLGAKVKKGAKGVLCSFYKPLAVKEGEGAGEEQGESVKHIPMLKPFWLFNVADIEGLPTPSEAAAAFHPIEQAERILQASGANIQHADMSPRYRHAEDAIVMPHKHQYSRSESYYVDALHELTHWTGHPERLNRIKGKRFGDLAYAFEELVAELGSAFLMAHLGFSDMTLSNHASYIDNWLEVLKGDKAAVFRASHLAYAAFEYVIQLGESEKDAA